MTVRHFLTQSHKNIKKSRERNADEFLMLSFDGKFDKYILLYMKKKHCLICKYLATLSIEKYSYESGN